MVAKPKRILIDAYYQVLEMLSVPIVIWNQDDGVLYANRQTSKLLGFSHDEMLVMNLPDLLAAEDLSDHEKNSKVLSSSEIGRTVSMRASVRNKAGEIIPVELIEATTLAGSGTIIYSTIIKEFEGVQRQLKEQLARVSILNERVEQEYPHVGTAP